MRKIFTLVAAAVMTLTASAQNEWKADGDGLTANQVLVDNGTVKITALSDANGGKDAKEICGVSFDGWFQLRTDTPDPTPDATTPGEYSGSTAILVEVKANVDLSAYYRRQKGSGDAHNAGDNKDLLCKNLTTGENVTDVLTLNDPAESAESYALVKGTFSLTPGSYMLYRRGSTMRVYGFTWTVTSATEPTPVEPSQPSEPSTDALMSWDFTKWSDATVANLKAGANWSDIEKDSATEPTAKSKDNCFWQVSFEEGKTAEGYLTANDVVIEELKGLVYTNEKGKRSLAIAVNYPDPNPDSDFGPYHGPAYLWLGSKEINYFVIPAVPAGATIKMGVESHKITDARGVELSIDGGTVLTAPDGKAVEPPTTYVEQEWIVPATAAATNDVQITNTNGCHIYFITVTAAGATTAIQTIELDENAPVEYFNLQGMRVKNPANGIFIKRQGTKVSKVIM